MKNTKATKPIASKYPLKAWGDPLWQRRLSETLTVSRVDEDIPTDKQKPIRKPWFVALTRTGDSPPPVSGVPDGDTVLLSEGEVLALVAYLFEPQTAAWVDNPSVSERGEHRLFPQPGMVWMSDSGEFVNGELLNGEAHWTPDYFRRRKAIKQGAVPRKVHTLPWRLEK